MFVCTGTLEFLIKVLDRISVLGGKFVKINKHTDPNKHKSGKCMQARPLFMGKGHDGSDLVPLLLDNKSSTCNLGTSKQQEAK